MLSVDKLTASIHRSTIIQDICLHVDRREFIGIIGPNGSGKSTLLKTIYLILKPDSGVITLDGDNIQQISARRTAQKMAVVSQEAPILFEFSVQEIVYMGRSPHKRLLEGDTADDQRIVEDALTRVDMLRYKDRSFTSLSGGEKQRVMIARALAQQATFLVLDEPTNHLDIHHQLQIMDLVKVLDVTVIAALHDLNLAAAYCDRLYMLDDGKLVAMGTPAEVLTVQNLRDIFGVETDIMIHPITRKTHITFLTEWITKQHNSLLLHV
jgi:iron complex transport system ATP-binding protein